MFSSRRQLQSHQTTSSSASQNIPTQLFPTFDPDGFNDLFHVIRLAPPTDTGNKPAPQPAPSDPASDMVPCTVARKRTARTTRDRYRKITTAQGLRDRRMRLSLDVAQKFFHLQDVLGFDRPSKTVDWLLTKSKNDIESLTSCPCPCGGSRSQNREGSSGNTKVESSSSECEVDSRIEEKDDADVESRVQRLQTIKSNAASASASAAAAASAASAAAAARRSPTGKAPRKIASANPVLLKELRAKARERARERTREKGMLKTTRFEDGGETANQAAVVLGHGKIRSANSIMEYGDPSLQMMITMLNHGRLMDYTTTCNNNNVDSINLCQDQYYLNPPSTTDAHFQRPPWE